MKKISFFAMSMMALSFVACGGGEKPVAAAKSDQPEWVMKGSGAFGGEGSRVFYGVGLASNIKNIALLQNTSDNRARAEITKIFETYSASLMKDYMASTSDGDKSSEEQNVEQAIKTFSAATLSGVQVVDRWKDKETGALYSLARLDLAAFQDSLGKMNALNQKAKEYIKQNAERVHADLEKEEAKAEARKQQ
jgi:hypothetical protein